MTISFRVTSSVAIFLAIVFLAGCAGYVPGKKAYWDAQVRELCAKDGGVRIFEKLRLSQQDLRLLSYKNGVIGVLDERLADPNAPVYGVSGKEVLRKANPSISRTEGSIVRRRDKKIMASWVVYHRVGGDFPSHAYPSSFECPDLTKIGDELQEVFIIEGSKK